MKNVVRIIVLYAAFCAIITHADEVKKYPWIEKYAPKEIKEWCAPGWGSSCEKLDKAMWCVYQYAKASNEEKVPKEIKQYCFPCYLETVISPAYRNIGDVNELYITDTLQYIARELKLSHEQSAELIRKFNQAMLAIQADAKSNPTRQDS